MSLLVFRWKENFLDRLHDLVSREDFTDQTKMRVRFWLESYEQWSTEKEIQNIASEENIMIDQSILEQVKQHIQ